MSRPLEPLQQATIAIADRELQAILLPNGQPAIAFAALCEALSLDSNGQLRRVRAHPVLPEALASAKLETTGGSQIANVLIAWGIPLWLAGIRIASVKSDAQQRLIIFQKEIVAMLYGRFFSPAAAIPEPQPSSSSWQTLQTSLEELEMALGADIQAVAKRVTILEAQAEEPPLTEHRHLALERLLAATIERLLEHERRLNHLKPPAEREKPHAPRFSDRHKDQRLDR